MTSVIAKDLVRKLKIKSGTLKRTQKELESYEKEAQKQQEKINKLKSDGTDPHTIKKQEEVLAETLQMIPDTKKRLDIAKKDLQDHMEHIQKSEEAANITPSEDWQQAKQLLEQTAQ